MARVIVFDVRFKDDQGIGQQVDTDLYADFYEDGNTTAKERRTRGTNRETHILQTADGEGIYYSTRVDITGYVAGDVTVRWYANRSGQSVLPSPFEETLPYPLETTLTGGFLTDYVKTMLGFPATAVELVGNHYTVVIDDTLAVYNQHLPRERFGTIGLVVGQNAYPLLNIPTRGPTHLHFIRKEGTPLISDPLFGREYPRGQQLDFDQYVLGISFWEILNRVTSQEPEWIWSAANQTLYINIGGTNIAGDPGSYYVMYRYYEPVGLDGVIGTHFNWFRRFCLAKSKQVLSRIRGKFSGQVPAPGGRITLDSNDLAKEGRDEEERLLVEIRNLVPTVPPIHG